MYVYMYICISICIYVLQKWKVLPHTETKKPAHPLILN